MNRTGRKRIPKEKRANVSLLVELINLFQNLMGDKLETQFFIIINKKHKKNLEKKNKKRQRDEYGELLYGGYLL